MKEIEIMLKQNDINKVLDYIEEIGLKKDTSYLDYLIDLLESTESNLIRNTIAIALADIGNEKAVIPLINILQSPKTEGARGTLIYALEEFDLNQHVTIFAKLLFSDSFEVSRHSFYILEKNLPLTSNELKIKCRKIITEESKKLKEKLEFINEATLNLF